MENLENIRNEIKLIPKNIIETKTDWCYANLHRRLESKFDKPTGKKAQEYVKNRAFVSIQDNCHIMYTCVYDDKNGGYRFMIALLYQIKTTGGKIYVLYANKDSDAKYDCFTAHYFDRYAERLGITKTRYEAISKRDQIIKLWSEKFILNNRSWVEIIKEKDGSETMLDYHPDGLGIGTIENNIILFKTFISNNLLKQNQIEKYNNIKTLPTQLEALKRADFLESLNH